MSILSSLLGLGQGQPTQVIPTAVTEPKIAEEIAPFLKDILGKGQALYKQRMEEGFVPFEGQTLADVTAQQKAAQEGIAGLVGTQKPVLDEAGALVRAGSERATAEALQPFMNPYQQAVTDIAKRQAQERFEQTTLPTLRKQAIDAGAFGGSRAAMRESQAQDAQARLLADIQAKGDLAAFQDARKAFEDQKTRERFAAEGLEGLTGREFESRRAELSGLQAIGSEDQARQQQLLDESYKRFLQERQFPEQQLGQYQSLVAGIPVGQQSITSTPQTYQDSPVERALGLAATGLGTYKQAQQVGLFSKEGGGISEGLASLPVVQRADAGVIMDTAAQKKRPIIMEEDIDDKSRGEKLADRFKEIYGTVQREEGEQSQGESMADAFKNFLSSLGISTNQPQQNTINQQTISAPMTTQTKPSNIPPGQVSEGEFGGEAQGETIVPGQNMTIPLQQELDDTIASQVTPDKKPEPKPEMKDDSIKIPSERDALKLMKGNIDRFSKALNERKKAALDNIGASKNAMKAQAQIDFLMGFGRGRRDPTDSSPFAGLAAKGQEAVKATKDFQKNIMALNQQELDLLDKNVKDQFDLATQSINLSFKDGDITRVQADERRKDLALQIQKINAGLSRANKSLSTVLTIISDDKMTSSRKGQLLDQALADNLITVEHYRMALNNPDALNTDKGTDPGGLSKKVTISNPQQSGQ